MRIMAILERYPQLSETYISTELFELEARGLLAGIVSMTAADMPLAEPLPFVISVDETNIVRMARRREVDALHTHYLQMAPLVIRVADQLGIPFTLRTHSYDVLKAPTKVLDEVCSMINASSCASVLGFPFICRRLLEHGLRADLLVESWPVIDFEKFLDQSDNANGVLNLGAALPKKNMFAYIDFALSRPDVRFSLYPVGYQTNELVEYNAHLGFPVEIHEAVQPAEMPQIYKQHRWLVYTSSLDLGTVGWPMAIPEAQASGLGVCLQSDRPDAYDLLDGAGVVFSHFREISELISRPVPTPSRERGFQVARRSDVRSHVDVLLKIWASTI